MAHRRPPATPLPPLPELSAMDGRRAAVLSIRNFAPLADVRVRLDSPLVVVADEGLPGLALLRAIRCLVDPRARPTVRDFRNPALPIQIELAGTGGEPIRALRAEWSPGGTRLVRTPSRPRSGDAVVYLDAARRAGLRFDELARRLRLGVATGDQGQGEQAAAPLLRLCEVCVACDVRSAWILIEAPELFLGPHAQRALAALLRALAGCGNRVIYTTHSPNLVDSRHTDGIVRVVRDRHGNLTTIQGPHAPPTDVPDLVRRLAAFDRERNAMFFARRVLLVDGASERLSLPFAFRLLGLDADAQGVAIVDAGGKGNLPFLARTLRALAIPTVVLHDRDTPRDGSPSAEEAALNGAIRRAAGRANVVEMAPDFEAVSGLPAHVRHKPSQAWLRYAEMTDPTSLPASVVRAIQSLMAA